MNRARVILCAVAALAAAGCTLGSSEAELERLHDAGVELLGPDAAVVDTSEGACVQLDGNPTCVRLYFVTDLPERERAEALLDSARAGGWEVVFRRPVADGTWIQLESEGFRAFAAVWNDEHLAPCLERPERDCADELQVIARPG